MDSRGYFRPAHPFLGKLVEALSLPVVKAVGVAQGFYHVKSPYAVHKGKEMRERLDRGETVYLVGLGPSGHNSAAALVEVSSKHGIRPICSNEEERYTAVRHDGDFPEHSLNDLLNCLHERGVDPEQVLAVLGSWDYLKGIAMSIRLAVEEAPAGLLLIRRAASPRMNAWHFVEGLRAPTRLKKVFKTTRRVPVIGMRHHNNHAYLAYAVSPFARSSEPTVITVIDGFGDDASTSFYVGTRGQVELLQSNHNVFDSLGMLYSILSSTLGGWTVLSSEGRFMGATAWGDSNRLTNPFYKRLRQVLCFGSEGRVSVDRSFIKYHKRGQEEPFSKKLVEIVGAPIPQEMMWNPDAVLNIDDIDHTEITRKRVDMAAALQLVFEDALVHIVDHLIRHTGSHQLVLSGGTALNCLANMRLMECFNDKYYLQNLGQSDRRLHLWVPPNPSDTGTAMGAAYQFAMLNGAPVGPPMKHAFLCGRASTAAEIEAAVAEADDIRGIPLGNIHNGEERDRIADAIANTISHDGVVGLFQGCGETGPRALGHRTIMANACNPQIAEVLNAQVKYREPFRPFAPMITMKEAKNLFYLSAGASDDDYNAYNYMVLTVTAKPESHGLIPGVIHKDGTSRIQIVREETDPFSYAILQALGRHLGLEVAVNTSLNVGTPIVQKPSQAIGTLRKSRGMSGLVLIASSGESFLVWHHVQEPPKDAGQTLAKWFEGFGMTMSIK